MRCQIKMMKVGGKVKLELEVRLGSGLSGKNGWSRRLESEVGIGTWRRRGGLASGGWRFEVRILHE